LQIGGSLGGLFNAIILKRFGHHIRILERTPTALLHNQGAGIVFGGPAQEFFQKYDRTRSSLAITSYTRQYLNKNGDVIDSEDQEQQMTSWDLLYNVLREGFDGGGEESYFSRLNNNEMRKVDEIGKNDGIGEYLYGHKVTSLTDIGSGGVEVEFEDKDGKGGSLKANMVIGADGPSSTVRKILMPDVERTYAGYVAWRGTVLESEVEEETRKCFAEKFTFFHSKGLQILA
jgi:2-polyprenyl-6-methoxyphenol hydroxylase-like FAD-dependent oxidoreductase